MTETTALPPLHNIGVVTELLACNKVGSVMVILDEILHPLASLTVTVYVPGLRLFTLEVVALLLQEYEYGRVPPVTLILPLPLFAPLQVTFVELVVALS